MTDTVDAAKRGVWRIDTAHPVILPDGRPLKLKEVIRVEFAAEDPIADPIGEDVSPDATETPPAGPQRHAGGGVESEIEVEGRSMGFTLFPGPEAPVAEAWDHHYRYTLVEAWGEEARLRIDEITDEVVRGSGQRMHIEAGESKPIAPGLWLRFKRHAHKDPPAGRPGALVVYVRYHGKPEKREDGGESYALYGEGHYNLSAAEPRPHWRWRDFRFTLEDSEYGKSMDLLVERIRLKPVAPPADASGE